MRRAIVAVLALVLLTLGGALSIDGDPWARV